MRFFNHAALVMLFTFFLAATAQADGIRLRYANFPPASTFPCVQMEHWAAQVQERTGGKLNIETYPGGTLLDARSILRGVARGQADIGCISLAYHPGSFPLFNLFGLPLGFESARDASQVLWEIFVKYQPRELARYKVLTLFTCAPSQVMSAEPVTSLEGLKALTLRASGSLSDVLEAFGGRAVSIPMSETPEALQKGVVKGVFSSWDTLKDLNYAERCRYGLTVNGPVYPFAVVMNLDTWNSLPADVQSALDAYAAEHALWTGDYVDGWGKTALQWSDETYGFTLNELPEADRAAMKELVAPLLEQWKKDAEKNGIDGQAVLDDVFGMLEALNSAK